MSGGGMKTQLWQTCDVSGSHCSFIVAAVATGSPPLSQHVNAVLDAGASRVELGTPHGLSDENGIRLLGQRVLPAIQR